MKPAIPTGLLLACALLAACSEETSEQTTDTIIPIDSMVANPGKAHNDLLDSVASWMTNDGLTREEAMDSFLARTGLPEPDLPEMPESLSDIEGVSAEAKNYLDTLQWLIERYYFNHDSLLPELRALEERVKAARNLPPLERIIVAMGVNIGRSSAIYWRKVVLDPNHPFRKPGMDSLAEKFREQEDS